MTTAKAPCTVRPGALTLKPVYQAAVVLSAPGMHLELPMAKVFQGPRGDPGQMTQDELLSAIDQGVAAQKFDFAALVDSAISI